MGVALYVSLTVTLLLIYLIKKNATVELKTNVIMRGVIQFSSINSLLWWEYISKWNESRCNNLLNRKILFLLGDSNVKILVDHLKLDSLKINWQHPLIVRSKRITSNPIDKIFIGRTILIVV